MTNTTVKGGSATTAVEEPASRVSAACTDDDFAIAMAMQEEEYSIGYDPTSAAAHGPVKRRVVSARHRPYPERHFEEDEPVAGLRSGPGLLETEVEDGNASVNVNVNIPSMFSDECLGRILRCAIRGDSAAAYTTGGDSYETLLRLDDACEAERAARIGLKPKQVGAIPTHKFAATTDHTGEQTVAKETEACAVCLEKFAPGETIKTLTCMHSYHAKCIDRWLKMRNSCPICKTSPLNV